MSESSEFESMAGRRPQRFGPYRLLGMVEILLGNYTAVFCATMAVSILLVLQEISGIGPISEGNAWQFRDFGALTFLPGFVISLHLIRGGTAFAQRPLSSRKWPVDPVFFGRAIVLISIGQLLVDELWLHGKEAGWWGVYLTRAPLSIVPTGEWFSVGSFVTVVWFFLVLPFILRHEFGRIGGLITILGYAASQSFVVPDPILALADPEFSIVRFIEISWLAVLGLLMTSRRMAPWTSLGVALVLSCRAILDAIPSEVWILAGLLVAVECLASGTWQKQRARAWRWPRRGNWILIVVAALLPLALGQLMTLDVIWIAWLGPLAAYWMAFAYDSRFGKRTPLKGAQGEG